MAPFYFGLVVSLAVLLLNSCMVLFEFIVHAPGSKESEPSSSRLSLDRYLADRQSDPDRGVFRATRISSRRSIPAPSGWPEWMTKVNFRGPEAKIAGLDRGISAIQVLKAS